MHCRVIFRLKPTGVPSNTPISVCTHLPKLNFSPHYANSDALLDDEMPTKISHMHVGSHVAFLPTHILYVDTLFGKKKKKTQMAPSASSTVFSALS